jgi:AsmA protein
MTKGLKLVAAVVAAVVALAILGAVAVAWLFNPNDYKSYAEDWAARATGRSFEISQDLELSFFPWLAVETGGITLGNAAGFSAAPFATIEHVAARVRLMPLLRREIEIGTISMTGLELHLARDADLRGNWEDLLARDGTTAERSPATPGATGPLDALDIAGLTLADATLTWSEDTDTLRYRLQVESLETGPIRGDAPVELAARLALEDVAQQQTVALELTARVALDDSGSFRAQELDTRYRITADTTLLTQGRLQLDAAAVAADGTASTATGVLETEWVNVQLDGTPLQVQARWRSAAYDPAEAALAIEDLTTRAYGLDAEWTALRLSALTEQPTLTGGVRFTQQPLAAALALAGRTPGTEALGDFDLATQFEADLSTQAVKLSGVEAALLGMQLGATITIRDGLLESQFDVPAFRPTDEFWALARPALPEGLALGAIDRLGFAGAVSLALDTGHLSARNLRAELLDASLVADLDRVPQDRGALFRGTVRSNRFAAARLTTALGEWVAQGVTAEELGTLSLDTAFTYDTGTAALSLQDLRVEAFGLAAAGALDARDVVTAPTWSGRLRVEPFAPRSLMQRFGQPVPATADPAALSRAAIDTRLTLDAERGRFDDIVLELDDSRITGQFTVDGFTTPRYAFTLAIDAVDVDRYLPPPETEAQAGEATAGAIELPSDALESLALSGAIEVGALGLAGMRFASVGTRIEIDAGSAALEEARASLYGGSFAGNLRVDARAQSPSLALTGKATGIDLAALIQDLFDTPANISATAAFDLDLQGHGRAVIDNVASAAGTLGFTLSDGALSGFNLGRTLCAAYNALQRLPAPAQAPDVTRFTTIQGTAQVANGVATTADLLARTNFMDVTGAGRLTLVTRQLEYDVDATLTGPVDVAGCTALDPLRGGSIPIKLRGTIDAPEITPDFTRLLQQRLRDEVQDRLQERLQDLLRR